jgi:hypothetical protein
MQHQLKHVFHYHLLLLSFGPIPNHYEIRLVKCLTIKEETLTLHVQELCGLLNRVLMFVE